MTKIAAATHTEPERQTHTHTQREREREREKKKEKEKEREKKSESLTETHTHTHTHTHTLTLTHSLTHQGLIRDHGGKGAIIAPPTKGFTSAALHVHCCEASRALFIDTAASTTACETFAGRVRCSPAAAVRERDGFSPQPPRRQPQQ